MKHLRLAPGPSWLPFAILGAIGLFAAATVAVRASGASESRSSIRHTSAADLAKKRQAAADLEYPAPGAEPPPSIALSYDAKTNRTKMTLSLKDLRATAPDPFRPSPARLSIVSEFDGQSRTPGQGELSVQCVLSLVSASPGALAPSSPPGTIVTESGTHRAKTSVAGQSGYRSKAKADGAHESLAFRISTPDLLAIARARTVTLNLAACQVILTPRQIADLKEFAARMNPNP